MGGLAKFIKILHGRGVFPIYYNITRGGGGGASRDPKFVLSNIWTAPYCSQIENCNNADMAAAIGYVAANTQKVPHCPTGKILLTFQDNLTIKSHPPRP